MPYLIITLVLFVIGCSESGKTGGMQDTKTASSEQQASSGDCRDHLEKNVDRCYREISKMLPNIDSNLVADYCDCVNREIVNKFSCEQILSMKKLPDKELRQIYLPIKNKCIELYLRDEMERARMESVKDSL